jgi:hypothetical protein
MTTKDIHQYSNPQKVLENGIEIFGPNFELYISSRKDKKYTIIDPYTKRHVHFGQLPYEDFTKHGDEARRQRFLRRNARWKDAYEYSPAFLSYHLLW